VVIFFFQSGLSQKTDTDIADLNFGVIYHITSIYGLENEPILDLDWKSN